MGGEAASPARLEGGESLREIGRGRGRVITWDRRTNHPVFVFNSSS